MTRIDDIRERLDKARPGLGEIDGGEESHKRRGNPKGSYTWTLYGTYADAILLVNARNDLAWCLAKLDAIRAVYDQHVVDVTPGSPAEKILNILNDTKEN